MDDIWKDSYGHIFQMNTLPRSISQILDMIKYDRLQITDMFINNRRSRINIGYMSRFTNSNIIESILLGFPLPKIYCDETIYGNFVLIDGIQTIEAIRAFVDGKFRLNKPKIRKDLERNNFKSLSYQDQRQILEKYELDLHIINSDNECKLKYAFIEQQTSCHRQALKKYFYPYLTNNLLILFKGLSDYLNVNLIQDFEISYEVQQFLLYLYMLEFYHSEMIDVDLYRDSIDDALLKTADILNNYGVSARVLNNMNFNINYMTRAYNLNIINITYRNSGLSSFGMFDFITKYWQILSRGIVLEDTKYVHKSMPMLTDLFSKHFYK